MAIDGSGSCKSDLIRLSPLQASPGAVVKQIDLGEVLPTAGQNEFWNLTFFAS